MRYEGDTLVATPVELAGAAAALDLGRGPLSTTLFDIGGSEEIRAFEDSLVRLDDAQRDIFEMTLPIVCDPVRSAMVHTTMGTMVRRRFLAWNGEGELAAIEQVGDEIGLLAADTQQLRTEVLDSLVGGLPFTGSDVRIVMQAVDALVLVNMADALRRDWLLSLLNHESARTALSVTDVASAVIAAAVDDPRWTSCMLDKALPAGLRDSVDEGVVDQALHRLVQADALEAIDGDETASALYAPMSQAAAVLEGIAGASARAAITVYGMTGEGPGYETTLFARGTGTVWMVMISPIESFVASASPTALATVVDAALGLSE